MSDSKDLSKHLALITGASGGIGRATALALAKLGCNIAVHYNSNDAKADALVEELMHIGVRAKSFGADLGDYEQVRQLHRVVVDNMGHPTILFANAGATLKHGVKTIEEIDIEEFEKTWRINCGSPYLLAQLCIPAMEKAGWGRLIFCSSVAAFIGGVVGPHYASSKSALHGLIHWLAMAYSKKGITVNGVAPALIKDTALLPGDNDELAAKIPIGRLGRPDEIADTVVWMVNTGYLTNKVIGVDGGFYAY